MRRFVYVVWFKKRKKKEKINERKTCWVVQVQVNGSKKKKKNSRALFFYLLNSRSSFFEEGENDGKDLCGWHNKESCFF